MYIYGPGQKSKALATAAELEYYSSSQEKWRRAMIYQSKLVAYS